MKYFDEVGDRVMRLCQQVGDATIPLFVPFVIVIDFILCLIFDPGQLFRDE